MNDLNDLDDLKNTFLELRYEERKQQLSELHEARSIMESGKDLYISTKNKTTGNYGVAFINNSGFITVYEEGFFGTSEIDVTFEDFVRNYSFNINDYDYDHDHYRMDIL